MNRASWTIVLAALSIAGCGRNPAPPIGTGAKEAVETYEAALIQQDWSKAYSHLDSESQRRVSADEFRRLAERHRRNLGFEPESVKVQSCDEHDAEAIAHVVFVGNAASRQKRYKDAVSLGRADDAWRVVLSPEFGKPRNQ